VAFVAGGTCGSPSPSFAPARYVESLAIAERDRLPKPRALLNIPAMDGSHEPVPEHAKERVEMLESRTTLRSEPKVADRLTAQRETRCGVRRGINEGGVPVFTSCGLTFGTVGAALTEVSG
jgi:hypothetical protein